MAKQRKISKPRKYEFTGETDGNLRRIRALMDLGSEVRRGEVGGWIQHEHNLSHEGLCWVRGDARVFGGAVVRDDAVVEYKALVEGDARIYGASLISEHAVITDNAHVSGYATVDGQARVFSHARVFASANVSGDARVGGKARVSGDSYIHGSARISGTAQIMGDAVVSSTAWIEEGKWRVSPFQVQGSRHFVCFSKPGVLRIGCREKTLQEWLQIYATVGDHNGYSKKEIREYLLIIQSAAAWYDLMFGKNVKETPQ